LAPADTLQVGIGRPEAPYRSFHDRLRRRLFLQHVDGSARIVRRFNGLRRFPRFLLSTSNRICGSIEY
jgi:hypothetical protein